jgi:cysteine desulfurase/selenocysteine lyase
MLDPEKIRKDFPLLKKKINGKSLIYFDNAATTQKPFQVIQAIADFYENKYANIHRGVYRLSKEATEMYENAHENVARFINAEGIRNIIFVRNTTEALNLVAYAWGMKNLKKGDEIIISIMEHHSNMIPWRLLSEIIGIKIKYLGIRKDGTLNIEQIERLITKRTKLISITHVSNVLGVVNPVREIGNIARDHKITFCVDAAQSAPHMPIHVKKIGCDFLAFSAHKMLGPTGIGVLYATDEMLGKMRPFLGGGDMIEKVTLKKIDYAEPPWKFEAGTANISGAIGFSAAIDYLRKIGMEDVNEHEKSLTKYCMNKIANLGNIEIYGPNINRIGIVPFNVRMFSCHDVAIMLDEQGIAVRSGYLCAQPLVESFSKEGVVRASFYLYNTKKEIDKFIEVLREIAV